MNQNEPKHSRPSVRAFRLGVGVAACFLAAVAEAGVSYNLANYDGNGASGNDGGLPAIWTDPSGGAGYTGTLNAMWSAEFQSGSETLNLSTADALAKTYTLGGASHNTPANYWLAVGAKSWFDASAGYGWGHALDFGLVTLPQAANLSITVEADGSGLVPAVSVYRGWDTGSTSNRMASFVDGVDNPLDSTANLHFLGSQAGTTAGGSVTLNFTGLPAGHYEVFVGGNNGAAGGKYKIALTTSPVEALGRVSVDSSGIQGNGMSRFESLSADGRYVAFWSEASNLVPGDANGKADIFVRDLQTGKTSRVTVDSSGQEANDVSYSPLISANGRYVAFQSSASNLVAGDTNNVGDAFVHDRETGATVRVSIDSTGREADGASYVSAITADGRHVAFASKATNLVAGDANNAPDIFVHDLVTGQTQRASVSSGGQEGDLGTLYYGLLSDDGRYVAFFSQSTNLVPNDTNQHMDVFVRDMKAKTTERASVGVGGQEANGDSYFPSLSSDGRYLAFTSGASNLVAGDNNLQVDVFVLDRSTRKMQLISVDSKGTQGNAASSSPHLSADGRYVDFDSAAGNLVAGDTNGKQDTFVHDRTTHKTTRISTTSKGKQGNGDSFLSGMAATGRYVAFSSDASNLVAGDTNGVFDVFVRDRSLDATLSADLVLTQTDTPDPVAARNTVTYTVNVVNHGPDTADVNLQDILPRQATMVSRKVSQGRCYKGRLLVCRLGTLAPGQSATLNLTVRADRTATNLVNQAQVQGSAIDPNPDDNGSLESTVVGK